MILNLQMIGRLGNQMFQYAHARAIAERYDFELRTPRWIGESIFQIPPTAEPDYSGQYLHGYFQNQTSAIYTASQARSWFQFKPWVHDRLDKLRVGDNTAVCHWRSGDYLGYGFVRVSMDSYFKAVSRFAPGRLACFVSDDFPTEAGGFYGALNFLPDFYIMCTAPVLFRGNSTFSWWASVISGAKTFSPIIDGLVGGKDHDVEFTEGNHPKLCNLEGFTDIHLLP